MDHHFKRPSIIPAKKQSSDKKGDKHHTNATTSSAPNVKFEFITESPPVVFLDNAQQSTGALYSVVTRISVLGKPIVLTNMTLRLENSFTTKRPVAEKCKDCAKQTTVVKEWKFFDKERSFPVGQHDFPASHLIPGHLPVSTQGYISSVEYQLILEATTDKGDKFTQTRPVNVQRAVRPAGDKSSIRVFPPTDLTLHVTVPSVVYPIGDFNVLARMSGLITTQGETQTRWRLRKVDWKIEEHEVSISPACAQHAAKVGGEGKGVMHEHTRSIGEKEVKAGWKTDLEAGEIEGDFVCSIDASRKPNTQVETGSGFKINHVLVLEMVIAEEWAPAKRPKNATPTGVARVLRTQFNLTVTQRAGMGIAWDDEQPPLYEDVPASPPAYLIVKDYDGPDLNEDIDHLHLGQ